MMHWIKTSNDDFDTMLDMYNLKRYNWTFMY